ncbi:hypothetical protein IAD21_02703 [Abditibacteriota bacterium]|nr:hypothetical protein IAD21_02703 [Abditibacteriota bacterium]
MPVGIQSAKNKIKDILGIKRGLDYEEIAAAKLDLGEDFAARSVADRILLVSHSESQCGIQQYGVNVFQALRKSTRYNFCYCECSSAKILNEILLERRPRFVIYNYYPATMPWLTAKVTRSCPVTQLGIMHEVTQEEADNARAEMFDFHLCPDPTLIENNPLTFKTPRLIPTYNNELPSPSIVTIGSFGFGFADKGFERLIQTVQNEFDEAHIVLRLPFNDIIDQKGKNHALVTAARCREFVTKPKIKLTISHDFLSKTDLLNFLASNTLNCFFYDPHKHRGISSTIEHALAVQRPLAITRCGMFRHVSAATPSICIENSSLKQIIGNGISPLEPFYEQWNEKSFIAAYEKIIDKVASRSTMN